MRTIVCQPNESHPGKLHATYSGKRSLCGRRTNLDTWGNMSRDISVEVAIANFEEEDCQRCLKKLQKLRNDNRR